jgi:hypothetical protein
MTNYLKVSEAPKTKLDDQLFKAEADEFLKNFLKNKDKQSLYTTVDNKVPIYGETNLGLNPHFEGGRQIRLTDEGAGLFKKQADQFQEGYNLYDLLHRTKYHLRKNKQGGQINWLDKYK